MIFLTVFASLLVTLSAVAAPLSEKRPWEGISDPLIMGANFERSFAKIPLEGKFKDEKKLWSGDYWPLQVGNINFRWNAPVPTGFNLISPTKEEAARMSVEVLKALAPSEKFDILNGRYDYPLKNHINTIAYPDAQDWEGICHGWAPATMNHDEPQPKVLTNPDGIKVPFGSSDIKALLSHYYANVHEVDSTNQMGSRCYRTWWRSYGCDQDMNAGAFHIVLGNRMGLEGKTFIADMDSAMEVWNHPLHSYRSLILQDNLRPYRNSAKGTVKMVHVRTEMKYVLESEKNTWTPIIGTELQLYYTDTFEYMLDLNKEGQIIGGEWLTITRPDFLWTMVEAREFKGDFARLGELLAP